MSTDGWNWFRDLFLGSGRERELQDTIALAARVKRALRNSPFADEDRLGNFIIDLIHEVCERRGVTPSMPLGEMLYRTIKDLLYFDGILVELPEESVLAKLTLEEGVLARATLNRQLRLLADHDRLLTIWRDKLVWAFSGMLEYFPLSAFTDIDEKGVAADDSVVLPEARAYDLCDNLPEVLDRLLITFFDEDVSNAHLFAPLRERFDENALRASGIPPEKRHEAGGKVILPSSHKNTSPEFLIEAYLQGTPFVQFFYSTLPFAIPFPARFEHTHIIGGTGHGKTQLIQFLIHHDLVRAGQDQRSVIVMDSQGDLIRTISRLGYFSPDAEDSLASRFVMIDPTDIEHPIALNMFDFNRSRLSGFAPLDREKIFNATVELYEYFFGALLGAELTQRQGLIFRYLARLLIEIPGATIHTLRELMEDGEKFLPHMEKLEGTTRAFFATRFFDPTFRETKKQILSRLWGVLGNRALERMFSHKESKVDLFGLMNSGKIIFINTAKDLLGQDGAAIFGRFFVALIAQAAVQRSAIPAHERSPCFVYIDEAQDYFDASIANLLTQARKFKVGLIFAHQSLDQLGPELRGSVLANTTIKFAGGVSARDATAVAQELRCDSGFVLAQRRGATDTHFACWVRNFTGKALSVSIPLGLVESLPMLSKDDAEHLRKINRDRYSAPAEPVPEVPFARRPEPAPKDKQATPKTASPPLPVPETAQQPPPGDTKAEPVRSKAARPPVPQSEPGKGGQDHKYFQHLIKRLAEERGFRATVEEEILDGKGQVDVSLSLGKRRIACEISVTTNCDHELQNIEKCLAAGYKEIVLIGVTDRHSKSLAKFIEENLEEGHGAAIQYASPESLIEYLDGLGAPVKPTESTVRGYRVKTTTQRLSPEDVAKRRRVLAQVIAKSLTGKTKS